MCATNITNKEITLESLLEGNKAWVQDSLAKDPNYFTNLAKGQSPHTLWIGCSDSRVPANEVVNANPGDLFVHRNIANVVVHTDLNLLSVLEYAVNILKVKRVIVCGHYGCGGVAAALSDTKYGLIDNWLRHIKDVRNANSAALDKITDSKEKQQQKAKEDKLVELNAIAQASNICQTSIVQNVWAENKDLEVYAWVYQLNNGLVKVLASASRKNQILCLTQTN